MRAKNWMFLTILFLLLSSCNLMPAKETPAAEGSEAPEVDVIGTAVELSTIAGPTELAGKAVATATDTPLIAPTEPPTPSFTPSPTPQVVAASATSLPKPRTSIGSSISISDIPLPDLVASEMRWSPNQVKKNQPITILVKVTNKGTDLADEFTVVWLSDLDKPGCDWTVSELDAGEFVNLNCDFTYAYDDYPDATFVWVTLKVDPENDVTESNESKDSNSYYGQITFRK